jgi:hypothetical protein
LPEYFSLHRRSRLVLLVISRYEAISNV